MMRMWQALLRLWNGDAASSRVDVLFRAGAWLLVFAVMLTLGLGFAGPIMAEDPPTVVSATADDKGKRFGLDLAKRKKIFKELSRSFASATRAAKKKFKKHKWSQQDDRANRHTHSVRGAARRHKIKLSQAYMVFEEGVRERWKGHDGKPIDNHIEPFQIRKR